MTIIGVSSITHMISQGENVRLPYTYVNAIYQAGGSPLVIPVINDDHYINQILDTIDGLVIPGGDDINPKWYGEDMLPFNEDIDDNLDYFQIKLIRKALERDMPILGICRGIQVLNVAFGGSLYQDLSLIKDKKLVIHNQLKKGYNFFDKVHDVTFTKDSILYHLYGEKMKTNSFHHQVIKTLGHHLEIIGTTDDGLIEAIMSPNYQFVLGVQWHPERSEDQIPLFKLFIKQCQK